MKAIILAAGMGTRLGNLIPKPLTSLKNEKTILDYQIEKINKFVGLHDIILVVGYKHHIIMDKFPELVYVYNKKYSQTNTSKSLLCALNKIKDEDVIWMNGDIFFDREILKLIINSGESCCSVDNKKCGEEEVKYSLNSCKYIKELSKQVQKPKGESLGINLIKKENLELFKQELEKVGDNDYFEKALENLTLKDKIKLKPVDIGNLFCHEIDFPEDLEVVKTHLNNTSENVKKN